VRFIPASRSPRGADGIDVFFAAGPFGHALALEHNGIPFWMSDSGFPIFDYPEWLRTEQFGWLNAAVVDGAHLLRDWTVDLVFSEELLDRLGDCMEDNNVFVPIWLDRSLTSRWNATKDRDEQYQRDLALRTAMSRRPSARPARCSGRSGSWPYTRARLPQPPSRAAF
jgi:hypothetical protein